MGVAAGKGKGKGVGRRGGDKGKKNKGDKKSDVCRELRTTNPTRVQDDMTDLLKALIPVSTTEGETTEAPAVMYCGVRSRGYPFVDVPKTEDTTQTPEQRRFLRKKSPVSFKVEGGEVVSGLVKGCDDTLTVLITSKFLSLLQLTSLSLCEEIFKTELLLRKSQRQLKHQPLLPSLSLQLTLTKQSR